MGDGKEKEKDKGKDNSVDFEKSLAQLEELVTAMEEGELSLEESLRAFETGVRLTRQCQTALEQAEQKVQVLMDDEQPPRPLEEEDTPSNPDAS